jgi:hypothetical protein
VLLHAVYQSMSRDIMSYNFKTTLLGAMNLMLDFELDEDSVPYAVPIHMAAGALPSPPIPSLLCPLPCQPGVYSCLPCRLRRRVLSTQSFRVMEKKAMPTATLRSVSDHLC